MFKKNFLFVMLTSLLVSGLVAGIVSFQMNKNDKSYRIEHISGIPASSTGLNNPGEKVIYGPDFSPVAEKVMDAVVHIKSTRTQQSSWQNRQDPTDDFFRNDPFRDFFFRREMPDMNSGPQLQIGQGSGVIIRGDGYIVTNNHVVQDADDLEVTLHDNRSYKATVVGTDPSTDLALIRIKEKDLKTLPMVNSDDVRVGEWVLAVGNPFNLTSTVTAGIVSAKGRNINILREQFAVESFIQTDAAINPGNSGGALVNMNGGLIGINTAIASTTGAYAGYGFAIPANIVDKVVQDLMDYGVVQRGVLGIMIRTVDGNLKKDKDLAVFEGAYVDSLLANSAAGEAGIKPGDVILSVDDQPVKSSPELQESIARHRPGDQVQVKVDRKGVSKSFNVVLKNRNGDLEMVQKENRTLQNLLGAELETIDDAMAKKLDIAGGIMVRKLFAGKLRKDTNLKEGFIITHVDGKKVKKLEEMEKILEDKQGGVLLEGVYQDLPGSYYYAFGM